MQPNISTAEISSCISRFAGRDGLDWNSARSRMASSPSMGRRTVIQLHDSLVFDSIEGRRVTDTLILAEENGRMAGDLMMLDVLCEAEPKSVSSNIRREVASYLGSLHLTATDLESEAQERFERAGMKRVLECWSDLLR